MSFGNLTKVSILCSKLYFPILHQIRGYSRMKWHYTYNNSYKLIILLLLHGLKSFLVCKKQSTPCIERSSFIPLIIGFGTYCKDVAQKNTLF